MSIGMRSSRWQTLDDYTVPSGGCIEGNLTKIGDTVTEGESINFKGIPSFAPQIFRYIVNADPEKEKQYHKGLDQLAEEGVVQIFSKPKR